MANMKYKTKILKFDDFIAKTQKRPFLGVRQTTPVRNEHVHISPLQKSAITCASGTLNFWWHVKFSKFGMVVYKADIFC